MFYKFLSDKEQAFLETLVKLILKHSQKKTQKLY